jgi:chemotaxis protein methyltransferase CheR
MLINNVNKDPETAVNLEEIEIELLLEGIYRFYGFDFREYAYSSMRRRVWAAVHSENLETISALQEKILHDHKCLDRFILSVSLNVTMMFRDPAFFLDLRENVLPVLREKAFFRVWLAGCCTGEEVYSMAIMLEEEGLYDHCKIYATDINDIILKRAKNGVFPLDYMRDFTINYRKSGGFNDFSQYYTTGNDSATFKASLRRNVIFSYHNLVTDAPFNEFDLILCRNVLIYFNKTVQNKVHELLYNSLEPASFLCLGKKESIKYSPYENSYHEIGEGNKIFMKIS